MLCATTQLPNVLKIRNKFNNFVQGSFKVTDQDVSHNVVLIVKRSCELFVFTDIQDELWKFVQQNN